MTAPCAGKMCNFGMCNGMRVHASPANKHQGGCTVVGAVVASVMQPFGIAILGTPQHGAPVPSKPPCGFARLCVGIVHELWCVTRAVHYCGHFRLDPAAQGPCFACASACQSRAGWYSLMIAIYFCCPVCTIYDGSLRCALSHFLASLSREGALTPLAFTVVATLTNAVPVFGGCIILCKY